MTRDEPPCDRRHVPCHFRDSATCKIEELVIEPRLRNRRALGWRPRNREPATRSG